MSANGQTVRDDDTGEATSSAENMKIQGEALAAKVKDLLHEGNVRRIAVKNDAGNTIIEIPVTVGVIAAVVAPVLTAVAAIAALASNWEIEVHRSHEHTPVS
jgi:hypothetical protein